MKNNIFIFVFRVEILFILFSNEMHTNVSKMRVLILINTQGLLNETFFSI
jgi:hypothetical protein